MGALPLIPVVLVGALRLTLIVLVVPVVQVEMAVLAVEEGELLFFMRQLL